MPSGCCTQKHPFATIPIPGLCSESNKNLTISNGEAQRSHKASAERNSWASTKNRIWEQQAQRSSTMSSPRKLYQDSDETATPQNRKTCKPDGEVRKGVETKIAQQRKSSILNIEMWEVSEA